MTMLIVHRKKGWRNLLTAVLAGLAKFTRSDNGANYLLSYTGTQQDWPGLIYEGKQPEAVAKVAITLLQLLRKQKATCKKLPEKQ
ncbi:MAG: hypothetical protein ACXWWD_11125 [Chitinophagaceae bacterium]